MKHFIFKIKNFFKYGRLGYKMNCDCCYNHLFVFMIEKLKQMEKSQARKEFLLNGETIAKEIKTARILLEHVLNDDYDNTLIGLFKTPKENDKMPWDEGYISPYKDIPPRVLGRHWNKRKRDFDEFCRIFNRKCLTWWV